MMASFFEGVQHLVQPFKRIAVTGLRLTKRDLFTVYFLYVVRSTCVIHFTTRIENMVLRHIRAKLNH
ncbi:hypothetical protein OUZ56_031321 [Daphnia magna]|uniref:Uncharacterized protein n=1 Tax=Daphnia magna TaxID=35525 RepID=A0ABQ9ZTX1_9CRUS|nr:hypothetical protein OUZ56_031321 [Daphnia magna]